MKLSGAIKLMQQILDEQGDVRLMAYNHAGDLDDAEAIDVQDFFCEPVVVIEP